MLGKLIKHDFRSLSRVLLPTHLAIIAATLIATAGFAFNAKSGYYSFSDSVAIQTLRMITGFLSGLMILAIFASVFLVAFIIFQRFYKSFMSDEGYLTFTLPVTTSQLLWSKLITAMLWSIINAVVVFVCILIFIAFGTSNTEFFNTEVFRQIGSFISEINATLGSRLVLPIIELIIMSLVALLFNILEIYLSLIVGSLLSRKHKILASIGAYFGINIVTGIITSIIQTSMVTNAVINNRLFEYNFEMTDGVQAFDIIFKTFNPFFLFVLVLSAALAAAFFVLSHYLLKNRLNLD